jgi:hypothetical protein
MKPEAQEPAVGRTSDNSRTGWRLALWLTCSVHPHPKKGPSAVLRSDASAASARCARTVEHQPYRAKFRARLRYRTVGGEASSPYRR